MAMEIEDPTERDYHITCKVIVKEVGYEDVQSKEIVTRTEQMVYLVPEHNTQMELFFKAWLPEDLDVHNEVVLESGYPIYGYFRGAVQRRNAQCTDHHIFVMSRGAEEDLKMMHDKRVTLRVLPASDDGRADSMKDFDLANDRSAEIVTIDNQKDL